MKQLALGDMFEAKPTNRLFLGIWPDLPLALEVAKLAQQLRCDGMMRGRPVDTDRLHLTLFHLGDFAEQLPPSLVPAVIGAMEGLALEPFEVIFDHIEGFGRHLLLRPSDELPALRRFRATLGEALIRAGLRRYVAPSYSPHVTLSYDPSDLPEIAVKPISWTVRGFHLVESLLGEHRHIQRGSWALDG
jgi:2'-5' RNA ligase